MIEFKNKLFRYDSVVDDWEELSHPEDRTYHDFEFSYCDYRIGDEVFTEMSPEFITSFQKEKFWLKLKL